MKFIQGTFKSHLSRFNFCYLTKLLPYQFLIWLRPGKAWMSASISYFYSKFVQCKNQVKLSDQYTPPPVSFDFFRGITVCFGSLTEKYFLSAGHQQFDQTRVGRMHGMGFIEWEKYCCAQRVHKWRGYWQNFVTMPLGRQNLGPLLLNDETL